MKIESLNTWGGRIFEPLMQHFKNNQDIDIFCLQEIYSTPTDIKYTHEVSTHITSLEEAPGRANLFDEIAVALPNHTGFFTSCLSGFDSAGKATFELDFGQAMFFKKSISILRKGETFVFREKGGYIAGDNTSQPRAMQHAEIESDGKRYAIANFHGTWTGSGKGDTQSRIEQSQKVKKVLESYNGAKILCGDFNLAPDTESIGILEEGMENLIKKFGVTSTRSEYYKKPLKFADYILVSPDITVKNFEVLQDPVSDHLPLQVEIL